MFRVEAEFEPKRKELLRKHASSWRYIATTDNVKSLKGELDKCIAEVTKAISKHYRRASIKVHPDRHGEEYQEEFDALTKARDTLSDVGLRHKYMEQMLEIVCKVGTHWVKQSHQSWVQKHQPDDDDNRKRKKSDEAGAYQRPLQIEGGLMHTKPRKPVVVIRDVGRRLICVSLQVPGGSVYEFNSYCGAVHITGERADVYNDDFEDEYSVIITRNDLVIIDGRIEANLTLPEHGLWNIRWSFALELVPGKVKNSERSFDTAVDLVSPEFKKKLRLMKSFEAVAKKRIKDIHAALPKLQNASRNTNNHLDIGSRHSALQEAIVKARQTDYHLERTMLQIGATVGASSTLTALREALARTKPIKQELDQELAVFEKRQGFKNFKTTVYDILLTGEASVWVATVEQETLKNELKGDTNRLYQLLMEGKKAYNLELVDAATLAAAAARSDIFTERQLQALSDRAKEAEIRASEEAQREIMDEENRASAEKARLAMEKRAALMERGVTVQILGLKNEPGLNGRLAIYMGLGQGDRYVLRLDEGRDISLRESNFVKWNGLGDVNFVPSTNTKNKGSSFVESKPKEEPRVKNDKTTTDADPVVFPAQTPLESKVVNERPRCKFGRHCKRIKDGSCKFRHSAEEIAAVASERDPTHEVHVAPHQLNHITEDMSAPSTEKSHINSEHTKLDHKIYIASKAAGLVVGKHGSVIKDIIKKSGSQVKVMNKQQEANGMCAVRIRGPTQSSVEMAASMIER